MSPDPDLEQRAINVIRGLAMDAPQAANSGHPGTAMALAPLAHVLWTRVMRYDAAAPHWPDRDRFVLSAGHASILLYSMLHLTGYDLTLDDLRDFRQWGSQTPGHPEVHHTDRRRGHHRPARPGLRQRRRHGASPSASSAPASAPTSCDHHTFVICGDGDLTEGISHEAASLAGHLGSAASSASTTTTTSRSTARPSWPCQRRRRRALRGLRLARRGARRGGQRPRRPRGRAAAGGRRGRPRRRCSSCAATSATRRRQAPTPPRPTATPWATTRSRGHEGDPGPAARRDLLRARRRPRALPVGRAARPRRARGVGEAARRLATATARRCDACLGRRGLPGLGRRRCPSWTPGEKVATREASGAVPPGPRRRRARASSPAAPTSPATPARVLKDHGVLSPDEPGGRQIYFGIREHGMAGGHERHGRCTAASSRSAARSSCSATTAARRSASPRCPGPRSSTPSPTTRSASARTAPPTSRSSTSPRCGPSPGCG